MNYIKVFNPDVGDITFTVDGDRYTVEPKTYVVVSERVYNQMKETCPRLECTPSDEKAYNDYRSEALAREKELVAKAKEAEVAAKKKAEDDEERASATKKIADGVAKEDEKKAEEAKISVVKAEKELIEQVEETVVETVTPKDKKKGKK